MERDKKDGEEVTRERERVVHYYYLLSVNISLSLW